MRVHTRITEQFILLRNYLTAPIVTRHFKAFKPFATFDAGKWLFSCVNPCVYFKANCGCMPYHIWMHEMYHMKKAVCLLEMWRDIWPLIALKCIQGFIKERSYLTALIVTRHFKAFKPFATFVWCREMAFVNLVCIFKQSVVEFLITFECMKCIIWNFLA